MMSWRQAFRRQAISDNAIRLRLNSPEVENCHRVHYLQMATEKLARSFLIRATDINPPPKTHRAFTKLLQTLKSAPNLQRKLGFERPSQFKAFIDSLLPLAHAIERLAPSFAGYNEANAEYPWWNPATHEIFAPCQDSFEILRPENPRMIKLEKVLAALLREIV